MSECGSARRFYALGIPFQSVWFDRMPAGGTMAPMLDRVSDRLQMKCPSCGSELGDFPSIKSASVQCSLCKYKLFWDGTCWDACADKSYPRDFARQWVLWEAGKLGDPKLVYGNEPERYFETFLKHTSLRPEDLSSKKILEVGFGHGRLLRQIQQHCTTAYGLDLSKPLPSAHLRPGSAIFGNLFSIPFAPHQFDLIICRGVVHCTPNPRKAFACLAEQVSDKGSLYMGGLYEPGKGNLVIRKIFPGLWNYPEPVRLWLAGVSSMVRSGIECLRERKFGLGSFMRHYNHYKLDMFDVICPRWTCILEEAEILGWYREQAFLANKVGYGDYLGVRSC
jgi:methyltransferase family protein